MESKITEKTLIPISLIVIIIGAVIWVTTVYAKVIGIENAQANIQRTQDKRLEESGKIDQRLSRIEGKLEILIKNLTKEK